jgi:hypothetical protein
MTLEKSVFFLFEKIRVGKRARSRDISSLDKDVSSPSEIYVRWTSAIRDLRAQYKTLCDFHPYLIYFVGNKDGGIENGAFKRTRLLKKRKV